MLHSFFPFLRCEHAVRGSTISLLLAGETTGLHEEYDDQCRVRKEVDSRKAGMHVQSPLFFLLLKKLSPNFVGTFFFFAFLISSLKGL